MNSEDCGGRDVFGRYKRASNVLSGLRADLVALRLSPYGRDRQAAIKLNVVATGDAQVELEAAFLAYSRAPGAQ